VLILVGQKPYGYCFSGLRLVLVATFGPFPWSSVVLSVSVYNTDREKIALSSRADLLFFTFLLFWLLLLFASFYFFLLLFTSFYFFEEF
jgi:hypothetical protein